MRGSRRFGVVALALAPLVAAADPCLLGDPTFRRDACDIRACVVCHDGGASTAVYCRHPVDVPYASAWLARRASLRAITPPQVPLTSGRITCATCHDGGSPARHHVAVVPGPMGLCGGCHAK